MKTKTIFYSIIAVAMLLLSGCGSDNFETDVALDNLGTQNLRFIYPANDALHSMWMPVVDGKCAFHGSSKEYTVVEVYTAKQVFLTCLAVKNGQKVGFDVQPPMGIIVDIDVIRNSPRELLLAGIADLVSNLSAIQDWLLSHNEIGEPINELAFMLAKESAMPILHYSEEDLFSDKLILDLVNGLITSGLSMSISGNTRGASGAEHMISHAIDKYYPEKATIHGLQVGWALQIIEKRYRGDEYGINDFFERIGIKKLIEEKVPFREEDFDALVPLAKKIRKRYTILNKI